MTVPPEDAGAAGAADATTAIAFRRPTEDDYAYIIDRVDEWWGGRRLRAILPRLWFQHFTETSWIAERADGRIVGFLVGFVSPEHPGTAYVHMIGTDPNRRRDGLGGSLYKRFFEDARARGCHEVKAVTWPGNRVSVNFHRSIGFRVDDGPGTTSIYGTPAHADYDGDGEDRVVFIREI
jgi:GNAT superfamily N-acetyltransferase